MKVSKEVTIESLKEFESNVVELFNNGELKSPVHLSGSVNGSQEDNLINIFKDIKSEDWIFSTYRSHYHALLKGVPKDELLDWIKQNKSIHFMSKTYKFVTSAIVGGCLPIALGTAMGIKYKIDNYDIEVDNESFPAPKVYIFIGDMTSQTGVFEECLKYAVNYELPIKFIVECNYLSTDTDTAKVWGTTRNRLVSDFADLKLIYPNYFDYYTYERKYPHYGTGKFISSLWKGNKENIKAKGF